MADPKYTKMPEPCGSCRFRAEYGIWHCNYSDIMGVTKHRMHPEAAPGALAGPGCLCYQRGRRRLRPSKVSRKVQKPKKRPAQEAQEARWEAMRIMYLQGGTTCRSRRSWDAPQVPCGTGGTDTACHPTAGTGGTNEKDD